MTNEQWERLLDRLVSRTRTSMAGWEKSDVEGHWILATPSGSISVETRPGTRAAVFAGPAISVRSRSGGATYHLDSDIGAVVTGAAIPQLRARKLLQELAMLLDSHDEELQTFVDNIIDEL